MRYWQREHGEQVAHARPIIPIRGEARVQQAAFEQRQRELRDKDTRDRNEREQQICRQQEEGEQRERRGAAPPEAHRFGIPRDRMPRRHAPYLTHARA